MSAPQLNVIRITNPFDPREHLRSTIDFVPGRTLAEYFPPNALELEHVYSINGKIVLDENFATQQVNLGDYIVCCPVLGGGGGGKGIFRLVAMIAIAVFAPYAATAVNTAMGGVFGAAGSIGMSLLTAGISFVGNMLVSALMPAPKKSSSPAASGSGFDSSPTYGVDGAKNTSAEGVPVPLCYGEHRMGGNIINNHVVNEGNTQTLYMLINAGEGPIVGISNIELNDQPIENFRDYEVQTRLGTSNQPIINWFDDLLDPHSVAQGLTETFATYITSQEIDKFRIDFVAPLGLSQVDTQTGVSSAVSVIIEVQYRVKDSGSAWTSVFDTQIPSSYTYTDQWYDFETHDEDGNVTGSFTYTPTGSEYLIDNVYYYDDDNVSRLPVGTRITTAVYVDAIVMSDKSRSAVRRSVTSPVLPENFYEIRYRRTTAESVSEFYVDDVAVSDINEIVTDDVQFNYTALLALKIRLNDQLSGIPKVTFMHHGKTVRQYDDAAHAWKEGPSSNPAWVSLDIMTNKRYGGRMAWSRFDLPKFSELARHCDSQRLQFNGVFDSKTNVWDATQTVLRCGHAQLVNVGTRYTLAIEKEDSPVMMFSVANMIEGTFKETWLGTQDRANEIEVKFFDTENKHKESTIRIVDPLVVNGTVPSKTTSVTLHGVTNVERAYKDGLMLLNMNRYILQTVEFSAPLEAIACTVGDLVYVQHDMPQWGYSGRFNAGSTTSAIKLDRPVVMAPGKNYTLLAVYDTIQRFTGTIASIAGGDGQVYVTLNGYDGTDAVERLKVGSKEVEVLSVFSSTGTFGVVIADATGMSAGNTYQLWDTNAMEERAVANSAEETSELTLVSPFSSPPAQFAQWMFGEVGKTKKPFRIKAIHGSHEYRRDIVAIEYNASVYDLDDAVIPTINYSDLPATVQNVTIAAIKETLFRIGAVVRTRVEINYSSNDESYLRSEVFVSRNGGAYESIGSDKGRVWIEADDGEILTIRVVARNVLGISVPFSNATTTTHTVIGKAAPPANVANFRYTLSPHSVDLDWDNVPDIDLAGYEIRVGPSWEAGVVVVSGLAGNTHRLGPLPVGSYQYHIKAFDLSVNRNYSTTATSTTVVVPQRAAPTVSSQIVNDQVVLNWNEIIDSGLLVDYYEIRVGATWATAEPLTTTRSTTFRGAIDWLGNRTFLVAAVDIAGSESLAGAATVTILAPLAPVMNIAVSGVNFLMTWTIPNSTLPIEQYEIRYGTSWAGGVSLGTIKGTTFSQKVEWGGARQFFVSAIDIRGNVGAAGSASLDINPPGATTLVVQTVDNNVLMSWSDSAGTLPIDHYRVLRGDVYATATLIGNINGLFSTIFEKQSGTYTYWIVGVDSAGNQGTPTAQSALVSQPPDYVLFDDYNSQLDQTTVSNVVLDRHQNYVLSLNGSTQYGSVASMPPLDSGVTGLTFESWFIMNTIGSGQAGFLEKTVGGSANTCALLRADTGILMMRVKVGGVLKDVTCDLVALGFKDGDPIYACGRWDSTNGVQIAVQGTNQATTAASGSLDQGAGAFKVGQLGTGATSYSLNGKLGQQRVSARRISDTEVAERYRDIIKTKTNLIASWNFSEGEGAVAYDDTDNAYDLQLFSEPTFQLHELDGRYDNNSALPSRILYPLSPTKTYDEMFNTGGRTTPQANIAAGYTKYCEPNETTGQYVENIDYGAVLSSSIITLTLTGVTIDGSVTITPTISYKTNIGDSWTDVPGVLSTLATNFRYVKITLDITATAGANVQQSTIANIRLDIKLKNDGGTASCVSTDSGGTSVNFTVDFVDVTSITVTPQGTTPVIGIYDFVDAPNPTSFKILLFDRATGNRVSGTASWSAKGA